MLHKSLFVLFAFVLLAAIVTNAHPHVFVDAKIQVRFDEKGFAAVKNRWVYDELYSAAMLASGDSDGDGKISDKENSVFQTLMLDPLEKDNYYNYVQMGADFLKVKKIQKFKASMVKGRLVLDFETVFSGPVQTDYTMLVVVVADPTNYNQITADMENAEVDAPEHIDVEYFNDGLDGLTLFRAFRSDVDGLYLRYKKK